MTETRKKYIAVALNVLLVVFELVSFPSVWREYGWGQFLFYTEDSNYLALVACALLAMFQLRALRGKGTVPVWVRYMKYFAVLGLTLTFLVVMFVLLPTLDAKMLLLEGAMPFHHVICPLLAVIGFLLFDDTPIPGKRARLIALIPTLVYAVILVALNILRITEGPYPFLMVYKQSLFMSFLWAVIVLGMAWVIAWAVLKINRRKKTAQV